MARFQKGQSGNPGGRPKERPWRDAIQRAIARAAAEGSNKQLLDEIADKVTQMALEGDIHAMREIGDRLEGKPAQAITGEDGGPVEFVSQIMELVNGSSRGLPTKGDDSAPRDDEGGGDSSGGAVQAP